ncbi:MAG: lamin tail domain-containing protein, partial [Bacteroidales bacterium]
VFQRGILLMGTLWAGQLQGEVISYSFENDTLLKGWIANEQGRWEVSKTGVISGTGSLHHAFDNNQAGTDYFFHAYPFGLNFQDTVVWQFKIRHEYLPSSANRWTFYLASGSPTGCLSCTEVALAVGVNLNSSDDALNLYSIDATGIHCLTRGAFNWEKSIGTGTGIVKVVWLPSGTYQLWTANAHNQLQLCEEVKSMIVPASCYFGISYTYSSAQDRKLWIDDISISTQTTASAKLRVDTFYFTSPYQLRIHFNMPLDAGSVNGNNVSFLPVLPNILIEAACQDMLITFPEEAGKGISGQLYLSHLRGQGTSAFRDTTLNVFYMQEQAFDVVFSELMVDPTPAQQLPAFEYIECYNRSSHDIFMSKWKLSNGYTQLTLPDIFLRQGEFLLLATKEASGFFDTIKNVVYCLPSSFLNNEKGTLWLRNANGEVICYVEYRKTYIVDKNKLEGGWSLEMIDMDNPCGGAENWTSSKNLAGGTPGFANSVVGQQPDNKRPFLKQVALPNDTTCLLFFSEPLHPRSIRVENFTFQGDMHPVHVAYYQNAGSAVALSLKEFLRNDRVDCIKLAADIADCISNPVVDTIVEFQLPQLPDSGEVVINEILFETDDTLVEFVEIYNTTGKYLDAGSLYLVRVDTITGELESYSRPLPGGLVLAPDAYLALTNDAERLQKKYYTPNPAAIFTWSKIFILPDQGGRLELCRGDGKVIDRVDYSPRLHFPLLQRSRGVSLERINAGGSGRDASNWHSAAATAGYATPGYKNSQAIAGRKNNNNWLQLSSSTFSPNNDGVDDLLILDIHSPELAVMITLSLYNADGRWLRYIVYQQYIGNEATFTWDGTVNGRLLPPGIYIIYARLMSSKRMIGELKKACTLVY